jgi:thiamine-monophosphate kinase
MPLTGEDRLLAWLRRAPGTSLLGDDAAQLAASGPLAVTVDSQIEGVHFVSGLDPAHLARRLLAVNLSDLAATGARPRWALLALSTPRDFAHRRFFRALLAACRRAGVELAGGDLSAAPVVTATLTLIGCRPQDGRFLKRSGARPGQALWLGGPVGESALGLALIQRGARLEGRRVVLPESPLLAGAALRAARAAVRRHLLPAAQVELGLWLGGQKQGGAIDVSDGLARDLHRLCRASGVGAEVSLESLVPSKGWSDACAVLGLSSVQLELAGGEDYVLLFTLPGSVEPPRRFRCRRIGKVVAGHAVTLIDHRNRRRRRLPPIGWDHLAPSS